MPGTRSNPLTLCCQRHTSGFGEAAAAPYPTVERPLLVTHVCTHTHSPMHTLFSFPPLFPHRRANFSLHTIFPPPHPPNPLLIQQGEGSTVSFKGSLSAAFPLHSRHGNSGVCVLEHVCAETQDVVGYCMLAQPALQTLGLEVSFGFHECKDGAGDMECLRLHKHRVRLYSVSFWKSLPLQPVCCKGRDLRFSAVLFISK